MSVWMRTLSISRSRAWRGPMKRADMRGLVMLGLPLMNGSVAVAQTAKPVDAKVLVGRAVDLAGGEARLRGVTTVAFSMMTQWQRTGFRTVPYTDRPSFEPHVDVRDYRIPAWRNTRDFGARKIINVVRDSIALTDLGQGAQPLSVAYVDERRELFLYTPDRLLLALLDAPALQVGRDTVIGGERHHRVEGTLADHFPSTVFFHGGTGLPTMLRFRAGHPNDFGLVPWGVMEVAVWYSAWNSFAGINIPTQWDVLRVGAPYKRLTVLRANFAPQFAADSFAVTDAQRTAYLTSNAVKPMHENSPVRGVKRVSPTLAQIDAFGTPVGAVRVGEGWLMLGAGHTPFNYDQGVHLLDSLDATPVTAVLAATAATANGGIVAAARRGIPIWVSAASEPFARRMLANAGLPNARLQRIATGTSIGTGADRVQMEPIDLPNVPNSAMVFQPSTGWLYLPDAVNDMDMAMGRARAAQLGWAVKSVGNLRGVSFP